MPIALGVAAGTTSGMTSGLINVEKNAKRTKEYVRKRDLFKTKEVVEVREVDVEGDEVESNKVKSDKVDVVEEINIIGGSEVIEVPTEVSHALETTTERAIVVEHTIASELVPAKVPASNNSEAIQPKGHGFVVESTTLTTDTAIVSVGPITTETPTTAVDEITATELKISKREDLFSQVSLMNKKMRNFTFKKSSEEKKTTISVTEIDRDPESLVMNADAFVNHGIVEHLDNAPTYTFVSKDCVA